MDFAKLLLSSILFLLLFSCKKNVDSVPPPTGDTTVVSQPLGKKIKSSIILPQGSLLSLASTSVSSIFENSPVVGSSFELSDSSHQLFETQFLTNANGDILMMGYDYPSRDEYDISSGSTAMALVMNNNLAQSLSNEGKALLAIKLLGNEKMKALAKVVDNIIQQGKLLLDTNNVDLIKAVEDVFEPSNIATLSISNVHDIYTDPIGIYRSGRDINLVNNGVGVEYSVGVYKNGQLINPIQQLIGMYFVPSSITDALAGFYTVVTSNNSPELSTTIVHLVGDGEFKLIVRSGKHLDGPEATAALTQNVISWLNTVLKAVLAFSPDKACLQVALAKLIPAFVDQYLAVHRGEADFKDGKSIELFVTRLFVEFSSKFPDLVKCGLERVKSSVSNFVDNFTKLFIFFDKLSGVAGLLWYANDFIRSKSDYDLCYTAQGNSVITCGSDNYSISITSGNNQSGPPGGQLQDLIKIKILDSKSMPASGINVHWEALEDGKVNGALKTDVNGETTATWRLGTKTNAQILSVYFSDTQNNQIKGSPIIVNATLVPDDIFIDPRDGISYTYRKIGTQYWMTQNMQHTTGKEIAQGPYNLDLYGAYYNGEATQNIVAPPGWHVPSVEEWNTLFDFLGGKQVAGNAMKVANSYSWKLSNSYTTNTFGFKAYPTGYGIMAANCPSNGCFHDTELSAIWWTSSKDANGGGFIISINDQSPDAVIGPVQDINNFSQYFSVRCIKD